MSSRVNAVEQWTRFSQDAEAGELWVDPVKARDALVACDRFIARLWAMTERIRDHGEVTGYGILPSGVHVRDVFAARFNESEQSLEAVIQDNIDVAERMRVVFKNSVDRFEEAEAATRAHLNTMSQTF